MKRTHLISLGLLALVTSSLATTAAAQQVTIRINGYGGTDPAIIGDIINRFVKPQLAKDNITVVYQPLQGDYNKQLTTALAANNAGDIFYVPAETLDGYVATNKLVPLNGLVNSTPFLSSLNKTFSRNGKTYAVAKDFNTLAVVYNKDIFDEAKVDYPSDTETWSTLGAKLTKVKQALGSDYYGTCLQPTYDRFGAFAAGAGWQQFDSKGKTNLASPAFTAAFNWYTSLAKNKVGVQPSEISADWGGACLKTGKVAAVFEGGWIVGFLRDNAPNLKWGTALMPRADTTKKSGNLLYTVGWAINSGSKNRDAAVKVLNALTGAQAQEYILEQGLAIPSRSALSSSAYFKKNDPGSQNAAKVFQGASTGNVLGFTFGPQGTDWQNPINTALAAVLSGQTDAASALKTAQQQMTAFQNR